MYSRRLLRDMLSVFRGGIYFSLDAKKVVLLKNLEEFHLRITLKKVNIDGWHGYQKGRLGFRGPKINQEVRDGLPNLLFNYCKCILWGFL